MPGSAGHSPLQPREAAKEMLTGHVVSQEPEIETGKSLVFEGCLLERFLYQRNENLIEHSQ